MMFPARTELPVQPFGGPSAGEIELGEYGNVALRAFTGLDDEVDNTLGYEDVRQGLQVLVRARPVGFFQCALRRDGKGWFVLVGRQRVRLDVTFSQTQGSWVVSKLLG